MFYVSSFSWTLIGDVAKKAELVISCISWTFGQELSSNICLLFKFFLRFWIDFPHFLCSLSLFCLLERKTEQAAASPGKLEHSAWFTSILMFRYKSVIVYTR